MWGYLIAGLFGFGLNEALKSKESSDKKDKNIYGLFVQTDDFDKATMQFDTFMEAQDMYEKIARSGKIKYKDLVTYSDSERDLYEKWKSEGVIGEEGYPKLSDVSKVQYLNLFINNDDVEIKEFK
jgi:hypothetical protein